MRSGPFDLLVSIQYGASLLQAHRVEVFVLYHGALNERPHAAQRLMVMLCRADSCGDGRHQAG